MLSLTYLDLLVRSNLRRMRHPLALILLLSGGQLLVGRGRKTALTEREQHLWGCRHGHDHRISGTKSSTNFLNIRQALSRASAIGVVASIFCLHLGILRLACWLAAVGMLNRRRLILIIASSPATF